MSYDAIRNGTREQFDDWARAKNWELLPITEFGGQRYALLDKLRLIDGPQVVAAIALESHPDAALFENQFPESGWRDRNHICVTDPIEGWVEILREDKAPARAVIHDLVVVVGSAPPEQRRAVQQAIAEQHSENPWQILNG